jgi:hypothetical protein
MTTIIKRAIVFCFFVAAAMIVAAPATAQSQTKTDAKEVKSAKEVKDTKDVKDAKMAKATTKTASCCADKKGADGKDCCADGKSGSHTKAEHEKMMKEGQEKMEKDADKKGDAKKDDGR